MVPVVSFSLIIFCITVQLWLVLAAFLGGIPLTNALGQMVVPEWQWEIHAKWDPLLFHCFVGLALLGQAIGVWFMRHKLMEFSFVRQVMPFLVMELVWTVLMLNASFKTIVYANQPLLARDAFVFLSVGAVASKLFWTELKHWGRHFYEKLAKYPFGLKADVLACIGLIILLFVPDTKAVLARMFLGDQFHHLDGTIIAPAWGYAKGAVLNIDIMTEYGVGIPVMTAWFVKLAGGFSYAHVFWFLMLGTIVYFILCFIFLRHWLKSFALALGLTLLAIKFQMFHPGVSPFVFTMPSASVMRYFWDIFFFLALLAHLRSLRKRYLFAAALCCGAQIFCMTTIGYCLTLAFLTYLAAFMIVKDLRTLVSKNIPDLFYFAGFMAVVPLTTLFLLGLTQGKHLWAGEFWHNMQEFNNYFLSGFGLMPMYETIQHKETLAGLMGFFIPVVYLGTFLVTAGLVYAGQAKRDDLMATILSLYGLAAYHYYIGRSAPTSYYVVCVPYVFILGFWANKWLSGQRQILRRGVLAGLLGVAMYALWTNHIFLDYPNILNISRNPMVDPLVVVPLPDGRSYFNQNVSKVTEEEKLGENNLGEKDEGLKYEKDFKTDEELKGYYDREFDFSQDASLIASLTSAAEPVALLSSFEIKILMEADRRPFFYYSPILVARPMRMRTFPISAMYSFGHAQRTLKQLDHAKPEYIFMERVFLQAPGTKDFKDASLAMVLNYVFEHYTPQQTGRYLVAMRRKEGDK